MASFPTSNKAQMRRCRLAQLHGRVINEVFGSGVATGYVDSIRADFLASPLQWVITISLQDAKRGNSESPSRYIQSLLSELHA